MFRRFINYFMLRNLKKRHCTELSQVMHAQLSVLRRSVKAGEAVDIAALNRECDLTLQRHELEIKAFKELNA